MALIKSTMLAEIRGSLAGAVYARNRGGQYVRSRAVPVNPGSQFQAEVRTALGALSARWRNTLTPAQRAAWDNYALNTPRTNALGDPINIGGIGAYIRGNVTRQQAGLAFVDDGPTSFGVPQVGAVTITATAPGTVSVAFDSSLPWGNETGAALVLYTSNNQSPAKNFFKGPYRFAGSVPGNSITPPTSPATFTTPYANLLTVGQKIFARAVVIDETGRLSDDALDDVLVV